MRIAGIQSLRHQSGLSLIELMIASALSLFLLAGVIQSFVSNKVTYRLQEGVSRIQENGRYGMNVLARDIRMGGYSGCRDLDTIPVNVIASNPAPPADFSTLLSQTVTGLNDVGAANAYGAAQGTDVLVIAGGSPSSVGLTGNMTADNANIQVDSNPDGFEANDLLFITDCQQADAFNATSVSNGSGGIITIAHANNANSDNRLSKAYGADAMVMRANRNIYFVMDSGNVNAQGDPILSLYQQDINDNQLELVEGVEDMQVTFGEDTVGKDGQADVYQNADNVTDWTRVVSVRLSLLLNSVDDVSSSEKPYQFQGTSVSNPGDYKLRREFTSTIALRNRVD